MFKKHGGVVFLLLILVCGVAFAEKQKETKYGVGWQATFPAWGISGMMDVADNVSVQGILGLFGDLKTYAGRGIYRFRKEPNWNTYGYGMIGAWSYTGEYTYGWELKEKTETTIGFGAGVGIDYNWQAWAADLPPIWWNIELGIGIVNFDEVNYDFSTLMFGAGAHYRF